MISLALVTRPNLLHIENNFVRKIGRVTDADLENCTTQTANRILKTRPYFVPHHRKLLYIEDMKYDPELHHRRSIRLQGYDYAKAGAYYVTICVHKGWSEKDGMTNAISDLWLGEIIDGVMHLNSFGEAVQYYWDALPTHHPVELDAFVIMPNHFHGVIVLNEGTGTPALGHIIQAFKLFSAKKVNKLRGTRSFPVWQRSFYEHIIRDEADLNRIREYIAHNPARWAEDKYNAREGNDSL